jgi:hypothetical protein
MESPTLVKLGDIFNIVKSNLIIYLCYFMSSDFFYIDLFNGSLFTCFVGTITVESSC